MTGKLIEYPFDTVKVDGPFRECAYIKVRLQTQADVKPTQFRGPLDCFRQTFQHEGFFGFYRVIRLQALKVNIRASRHH
jgi:mitochondrial ornithine carrier protein